MEDFLRIAAFSARRVSLLKYINFRGDVNFLCNVGLSLGIYIFKILNKS